MAERKVLNKYIPPDFDPDKLMEKKREMKKIEKKKNKNNKYNKKKKKFLNIRMMYPFTLKCSKCKAFTYVGTKFNSRVEKLKDETYLNIPIWKFYGKCSECRNEFIFKTDPKNGDYVLIEGGIRTYDAHKEQEIADEYYRSNANGEEDKVKNIENQSYNALQELKTNEQLEELQNMNKRHIDKFSSINKALNKLYEKNEMENNKNNIFMNNLDFDDEKKFFDLLNKNRKIGNLSQNIMNIKSHNSHFIVKDDEFYENVIDIDEMSDINEIDEKSINFSKKHNSINKKEENEIKNNNSEKDKTVFKHNSIKNNKTGININNQLIFSKKPLETHYKFIIKKKENISTILNEYNSDSSDNGQNEN
ncbi:conserved Plasmodium protein, unknown function [Plasmodium berghei]|uniref:CWC16 domain-containing protein, putative n=2 Tax=Plasmodium berghei TaxID=5821 RepID=A0A509ALR9_PLABA|nr:CWC16 domain-containing protein, putative [Plasmodium berghei ANKA]CXI75508.1 conserved Plasmodium protein, unknown function [Plasmodium berghei]SCM24822.1 conserved Plasmodium protein, unknown function [Plasmodium berghei]SCN27179.1 conserved Plasmodium protein, unknown function [Plasmodium berghei]SCO61728.1 conserved Plasmodium protein, unknown function [Plasmodium berghei]SCO63602.1 conserved Plasmodium protein, unknown function [Plasmodium berghei]|eukprot:XP_034422813.1 CWC16 domain-containing protein, putative [Plasmodium berghei ANKA]